MFDDFFDFINLRKNIFSRPVKDMVPYKLFQQPGGYILLINTLGISKEDIEISMEKIPFLSETAIKLYVKGKSSIEKIEYENSINIELSIDVKKRIESLSYECKDGLTLIYLKVDEKEPKIDQVKAKLLKDGEDPFSKF